MKAAAPARKTAAQPRRTQEQRSAETRLRLLDAAIQVLSEEGYANLTISKVTQRAGLTNGAMQHHFPSREDLLLALMDAVYPVLQIPFALIASQDLTIGDRVDRLVDIFWNIYRRPEYLAVWDIAFGSRSDSVLRARFQSYQHEITEQIISELAVLFADTELSAHDIEHIFTLTIGYMRGCALQALFGADRLHSVDLGLIKEVTFERIMRSSQGSESRAS